MDWIVADDIAKRLLDLKKVLGIRTQVELGKRAGVGKQQVGKWLHGTQPPSRQRLDSWAKREGWPTNIFEKKGPMPRDVTDLIVNVSPGPTEAQVRAAIAVMLGAIVDADRLLQGKET